MISLRNLAWAGCSLFSALLWKVVGPVLPWFVTCGIVGLVLGSVLYEFTRERIFTSKVNPDKKAVLVTGCDSGFGHLLAQRLDSRGYAVFAGCLDSSGDGATNLQNKCSKRLKILQLDVTSDQSVADAKRYIEENLGKNILWAVVNNAGLFRGFDIELTDISCFQRVMETNALGQLRVCKALLPLVRRSKGRVVNVNSLAGRISSPHVSAYTMSKFASVAFTECLRYEMEPFGVQVVSIEPSFFKTLLSDTNIIRKHLDETCNSADPKILKDYGENHVSMCKSLVEGTFKTASGRTEAVINAMESAVSLECPDSVYSVHGGVIITLLSHIVHGLHREPKAVTVRIHKLLMWVYHKTRRT